MKKISFILLLSIIFIASVLFLHLKTSAQTPTAPSNLTATALSCSQTSLSWQDNSSNETGFKIERKQGASGSWSQIGNVAANITTYTDSNLTGGATYSYRVAANSVGGGGPVVKYKCSGTSCVQDSTGSYTTSNCDNQCSAVSQCTTPWVWFQMPMITMNKGEVKTYCVDVPSPDGRNTYIVANATGATGNTIGRVTWQYPNNGPLLQGGTTILGNGGVGYITVLPLVTGQPVPSGRHIFTIYSDADGSAFKLNVEPYGTSGITWPWGQGTQVWANVNKGETITYSVDVPPPTSSNLLPVGSSGAKMIIINVYGGNGDTMGSMTWQYPNNGTLFVSPSKILGNGTAALLRLVPEAGSQYLPEGKHTLTINCETNNSYFMIQMDVY